MKWLAIVALLLLGGPARAQQKSTEAGAKPGAKAAGAKAKPGAPATAPEEQPASVKVTRGAGGQKVYRIVEGIVIEGKIQKPEAFYVLQRSTINYDWETLKQDFVPKILESVKKSPF
jgi:hypothetical protein